MLAVALGAAIVRRRWLPEAVVAVAGAALMVAAGELGLERAADVLGALGPTVGLLAALLVLAEGCRSEGVFQWAGAAIATRSRGQPRRLLALVFIAACATTVVLSLDATIVLLTPVVFATARRVRARPRPHAYACAHLANSASLLLPIANLTNLLAFRATGLSFARFALLMALPWAVAIAVEWAVLTRFFAADLAGVARVGTHGARLEAGVGTPADRPAPADSPAPADVPAPAAIPAPVDIPAPSAPAPTAIPAPRFALGVLAATLTGFALSSPAGIDPAWIALAGALVLGAHALLRRATSPRMLVRATDPAFLLFVFGIGVIARAATAHGIGSAIRAIVPVGGSLGSLLCIAAVAAVLANLVNNIPATLILVPVTAPAGPGSVLAALIGVNAGPNLTYVGSLATLLWRRVLRHEGTGVELGVFVRLGLLTVPPILALSTLALWLGLQVLG